MAVIRVSGRAQEVPASPVRSILVTLQQAAVPIETRCGGRAQCGRCEVRVLSGGENLSAMREREHARLREMGAPGDARLACQTFARGDVTIRIVNLAPSRPDRERPGAP
jgi:ferredoxin